MAANSPQPVSDAPVDAAPLIFRWRRFRFPSFKFFVILIGVILLHLAGFYLFELAQQGETQPVRDEARVLILRNENPESNRVLIAHFDALNAYEPAENQRYRIDTGVRLAPSFVDYSLQPLAMPERKSATTAISYPGFIRGHLAEFSQRPALALDERSSIDNPWVRPTHCQLKVVGTAKAAAIAVDFSDEFWRDNFGQTMRFDLGLDSTGQIRYALGSGASPQVLESVKSELLGKRIDFVEINRADSIQWLSCEVSIRG